jgi:hypothetical protein
MNKNINNIIKGLIYAHTTLNTRLALRRLSGGFGHTVLMEKDAALLLLFSDAKPCHSLPTLAFASQSLIRVGKTSLIYNVRRNSENT